MSATGQNRKYSTRANDFRFAPKSGHSATDSACPFRRSGHWQRAAIFPGNTNFRSIELECRSQERLDSHGGCLGCNGIVAHMHSMYDTGILVVKWLFGLEIDENSARLFLNSAVTHALKSRKDRCGLGPERIVESVRSIWVLGQFHIVSRRLQPFDVTFANRNRIVVVECATKDADRPAQGRPEVNGQPLGRCEADRLLQCLAAAIASEKLLVSERQRLNRQQFGSRGKILAALHGSPLWFRYRLLSRAGDGVSN